jgi:hypothetical protein
MSLSFNAAFSRALSVKKGKLRHEEVHVRLDLYPSVFIHCGGAEQEIR